MIKSIKLENFRAHQFTVQELAKVVWIVGEEEAGKSSIPLGLEFALHRRNEYLNDDRGKGNNGFVRTGAKKASVSCVTTEGEIFSNSIPAAAGKDSSSTYSDDLIKACLRSRYVLQMKEREQKEFFQSLFLGPVSPEVIIQHLNTWDKSLPDLGTWFKTAMGQAFDMKATDEAMLTFATVERKRVNAQHEAAKLWAAPQKPEVTQIVTAEQAESARKAYEAAKEAVVREEEKVKHEQDLAWRDVREWEKTNAQRKSIEAEIERLEKEVAAAVGQVGKERGPDIIHAATKLKEINAEITTKQKEIDKLLAETGECSVGQCSRTRQSALNEDMKAILERQKEAQAISRVLIQENNEHVRAKERATSLDAQLEREKKKFAELPVATEKPEWKAAPDRTQLDKLIVTRDMAQKTAEETALSYNLTQRCKEIEADIVSHQEDLKILETSAKVWKGLCEALGPHGIKTRLLSQAMAPFIAAVNRKAAFFGVKLQFDFEPWQIIADTGKGYGFIPVQLLSPTGSMKVSIPLQLAIAEHTGFPCVNIDEHGFGPMLRSRLFAFLAREKVQSIVISTLMEMGPDKKLIIPTHPGTPGVKLLHVQAGAVTEIKCAAEIAA